MISIHRARRETEKEEIPEQTVQDLTSHTKKPNICLQKDGNVKAKGDFGKKQVARDPSYNIAFMCRQTLDVPHQPARFQFVQSSLEWREDAINVVAGGADHC
jgi:hypothetical protein